ncbi:hypothetical protein ES705_17406 [subsurface metagenome]
MPVHCETCEHYQVSIVAKNYIKWDKRLYPCIDCARWPWRKDLYSPFTSAAKKKWKKEKKRALRNL